MNRSHYKHIAQYFGWEFLELVDYKPQCKGAKRGRTKYRKKLRKIVRKIEKIEAKKIYGREIL